MRKSGLAFFLALWTVANLKAQTSRWSMNVEAGAAIPVGEFGKKDLLDPGSSFAGIGPEVAISLSRSLSPNFGLSLLMTGQQNDVDSRTMDKNLQNIYPGSQFNSVSSNWMLGKMMLGGYVAKALDKKNRLFISARILAGLCKTNNYRFSQAVRTAADTTILGAVGNQYSYTSNQQDLKWGFAYAAGAGLRVRLDQNISLRTDIDFSATSQRFLKSSYTPGGPSSGNTVPPPGTYVPYPVMSLNTVSCCIGIEVNF
jgi:opacity protein-like surface antigen